MTAAGAARVELTVSEGRAVLLLTGRGGTNAMDLQMVQELDACTRLITEASSSGEARVLVIRADGKAFCVGGDLRDLASASDISAHVTTMTGYAHRAIDRLHGLDIPVVVRLAGAVAGGGIGLVLAGDVVVASRTASLTAGYAAAGLTPDAGVSWALPRAAGGRRFLDAMLTNRRVDAEELRNWGLVTQVVEPDDLDGRVDAIVADILRIPGGVTRTIKRLARVESHESLRDRLDLEAETIALLAGSSETQALLAELTSHGRITR